MTREKLTGAFIADMCDRRSSYYYGKDDGERTQFYDMDEEHTKDLLNDVLYEVGEFFVGDVVTPIVTEPRLTMGKKYTIIGKTEWEDNGIVYTIYNDRNQHQAVYKHQICILP